MRAVCPLMFYNVSRETMDGCRERLQPEKYALLCGNISGLSPLHYHLRPAFAGGWGYWI